MRPDGQDSQLDLVGVRPVRICLNPTVDVVWHPIRDPAGAGRAEFRGCDPRAAHVGVRDLGGAEHIVNRRGYDRAWIGCLFDEEEPVPGRCDGGRALDRFAHASWTLLQPAPDRGEASLRQAGVVPFRPGLQRPRVTSRPARERRSRSMLPCPPHWVSSTLPGLRARASRRHRRS